MKSLTEKNRYSLLSEVGELERIIANPQTPMDTMITSAHRACGIARAMCALAGAEARFANDLPQLSQLPEQPDNFIW